MPGRALNVKRYSVPLFRDADGDDGPASASIYARPSDGERRGLENRDDFNEERCVLRRRLVSKICSTRFLENL